MKSGGLRDTWQDFGAPTKALFVGMFLSGLVLLGVSIAADVQHAGWMADHAFIPNVLAGFSSFLVGVPVALVGFATITGQREEKAATDRVEHLTEMAWSQFRNSVHAFGNRERLSLFVQLATEFASHYDRALGLFEKHRAYKETTVEKHAELQKAVAELFEEWSTVFAQIMREFGTRVDIETQWFAIIRDWNTLDQYVRIQRLERGLRWLRGDVDSSLRRVLSAGSNPYEPFSAMFEGSYTDGSDYLDASFLRAYAFTGRFDQMDQYQFADHLEQNFAYFPSQGSIWGYMDGVARSATNVGKLYTLVEQAEASDWIKVPS